MVALLGAHQVFAQNVTVNLSSEKQTIRGFGGINHPEWAGDLTASQRTTAFGNGDGQLGMTVLRVFVNDDSTKWSQAVPTAQAAQNLGVSTIFATPWNPPSTMRTNTGSSSAKYSMNTASFAAYAGFLNKFVAYMKAKGVNLTAISIQNEPDYAGDWTYWSPDQVYQFALNYADKINTKVISAESFNYSKKYYDQILNDPKALANIDIVGTHLYGTSVGNYPYSLFDQKATGKERWMTEHYTDSQNDADLWPMALDVATELHNCMVQGQFNAYTWWYIRRKYSPMKEDGTISKRGYCFAQFSKFIRPGFVRVDATASPASGIYVSAYKKNDSVVVVAVNTNTASKSLNISIAGTKATAFVKYTTSSSKNLVKDGTLNVASDAISASLDAQSATTFVGVLPTPSTLIDARTAATSQAIVPGTYQVYDVSGTYVGLAVFSQGHAPQEELRRIVPKSGIYVVKSSRDSQAHRIHVIL
jgi:glucuronoarabinoxylan endo-1,4-beta-xylanase